MKPQSARFAADLLAGAWHTGMTLPQLPPECRPRTAAEGYRIQDLLAQELDFEVAGWKIGGTSAAARKILKARGPFAGRVFAGRVFPSGVSLPPLVYRMRGLEGEFVFRLRRDLPPRKRAYSAAEAADAVGAMMPGIEIIDSRYTDWLKVNVPSIVADQGANGALVLGAPVRNWRRLDLARQAVRMVVNGRTVGAGTGADCLGGPLKALAWLANLMRRRRGLAAGQIVSTGTCTGLHFAAPGDRIRADFGRLGAVELAFTN